MLLMKPSWDAVKFSSFPSCARMPARMLKENAVVIRAKQLA